MAIWMTPDENIVEINKMMERLEEVGPVSILIVNYACIGTKVCSLGPMCDSRYL